MTLYTAHRTPAGRLRLRRYDVPDDEAGATLARLQAYRLRGGCREFRAFASWAEVLLWWQRGKP